MPVAAQAAGVTLSWTAPTTNTDGTTLTNLGGYKLYYGRISGIYTAFIDVGNVTTYTMTGLAAGTWYFVATAYNTSGLESGYSNEAIKVMQNHFSFLGGD